MNQDKIYFFGYGANRDAIKIEKILGKLPNSCIGAVIEGFSLRYQSLSQVPDPAKGILKDVWGDDFKAYTVHPGNGIVTGVLWEIGQDDLNKIRDWEFTGIWREIIGIKAKTFDGREIQVLTEKAINSNENEGFYDGLNYPNNLNLQNNLITDIETAKQDFYRIEKLRELRKELLITQS